MRGYVIGGTKLRDNNFFEKKKCIFALCKKCTNPKTLKDAELIWGIDVETMLPKNRRGNNVTKK